MVGVQLNLHSQGVNSRTHLEGASSLEEVKGEEKDEGEAVGLEEDKWEEGQELQVEDMDTCLHKEVPLVASLEDIGGLEEDEGG